MGEACVSAIWKQIQEKTLADNVDRVIVRSIVETAYGILFLRRGFERHFPGYWELPGGNVDKGEDFDVALKRELNEETGLTVIGVEDPFLVSDYVDHNNLRVRVIMAAAYVKHQPELMLTEHESYCFFLEAQYGLYTFAPGMLEACEVYRKLAGRPLLAK